VSKLTDLVPGLELLALAVAVVAAAIAGVVARRGHHRRGLVLSRAVGVSVKQDDAVSGTRLTRIRKAFSMRRYTGMYDDGPDKQPTSLGRARVGESGGETKRPSVAEPSLTSEIEEDHAGL